MPNFKRNNPTADVLMTSMRSMGYSFEAALADVVDNSLSAKADRIDIKFPVDPQESYVAIIDNGEGMDSDELFDAMKYGSRLKKEIRSEEDLGRFGLGLKSASLSQCRKLTVISKKNQGISAYSWNLDKVEIEHDWTIAEHTKDEINEFRFIEKLQETEHGTIILWEEFDIIKKASGGVYYELVRYQDSAADYLSLIFHRFLNGEKNKQVDIYINNYRLKGLDPFLESHKKTNVRRKISLPVKDSSGIERIVSVQPFVLPFQKDLSKDDIKLIGGDVNYRTKQGFYIYRNERLIIWGTWFGRTRAELTKHARVKVDIPNTLDDIWQIDIKKQSAIIPNIIKNQLTKAVDEAMDIAVKAQTYRGRVEKVDTDIDYIWDRIQERNNSFIYRINRESRIFDIIKNNVDDSTWSRIDMVLEEIENSIPYQQIYIDKSQNKVIDEIEPERLADIESKANILISMTLSLADNSRENVIEELFRSEPFSKYPALKEKMLKGK